MLRNILSFASRTRLKNSVRRTTARRLFLETLEDRRVMDIGLGDVYGDLAFELEQVQFLPSIELSSKPGAAHTIYLDFDGHFQPTWASDGWTFSNVTTTPFDTNGDTSFLTFSERYNIREIWQRVAEDFAPFDVNVTTIDPGGWDTADARLMRVAFGGHKTDMTVATNSANSQASWNANANSGYAGIGSFTNGEPNVCYVFTADIIDWSNNGTFDWNNRAMLGREAEYMANVASHEVGHTMGLLHNHVFNSQGNIIDPYDPGTADRTPMMGESISSDRTTWANAQYDAIRFNFGWFSYSIPLYQDDLAILTSQLGQRADDHGGTVWTAKPLGGSRFSLGTNSFSATGIIETMTDADYFSFYTTGGTVNLNVNVAALGANLDARLELYQFRWILHPTGGLIQIPVMIASADPTGALNASLTVNVAAGTYYVAVKSHGTYGDLGQYTLTGTAPRWTYVFDTTYALSTGTSTLSGATSGFQAGASTSTQLVSAGVSGGGAVATEASLDPAAAGPVPMPYPNRTSSNARTATSDELFAKLGRLSGLGI
jgi:trimeric autotransporter adhesin